MFEGLGVGEISRLSIFNLVTKLAAILTNHILSFFCPVMNHFIKHSFLKQVFSIKK